MTASTVAVVGGTAVPSQAVLRVRVKAKKSRVRAVVNYQFTATPQPPAPPVTQPPAGDTTAPGQAGEVGVSIERVSTTADGAQANDSSGGGTFSPDGSRVAFVSEASNLVSGDSNSAEDVFVKALDTGAIVRVSTAVGGAQANGWSRSPVWSPDGSRIAFSSEASNLVPDDTNETRDVFVKTLGAGAIERVNTAADGAQADDGWSSGPVWSPDGSRIAFSSDASNLVSDDTNETRDVFVKTLGTGAIERVNTAADGAQADDGWSSGPAWSPDGSWIAFSSDASNLVPDDTNGVYDVFVKTLASGAIVRVNTAADGAQATGDSYEAPAWSPDGSRIAFVSGASNLVLDDTNQQKDVFVKTLATGAIERVNIAADGAQADEGWSSGPVWSPDGSRVAFVSDASNLVSDDTNGRGDLFVKTLG